MYSSFAPLKSRHPKIQLSKNRVKRSLRIKMVVRRKPGPVLRNLRQGLAVTLNQLTTKDKTQQSKNFLKFWKNKTGLNVIKLKISSKIENLKLYSPMQRKILQTNRCLSLSTKMTCFQRLSLLRRGTWRNPNENSVVSLKI